MTKQNGSCFWKEAIIRLQPEFRIAGLRINPNNFGPSRAGSPVNIQIKNIKSGQVFPVEGLPENLKASSVQWSPDQKSFAFTNSTNTNIDLFTAPPCLHKGHGE